MRLTDFIKILFNNPNDMLMNNHSILTNNLTNSFQISPTNNPLMIQDDWTKKGREEAKRSDGSQVALELAG